MKVDNERNFNKYFSQLEAHHTDRNFFQGHLLALLAEHNQQMKIMNDRLDDILILLGERL